MNKKIKQSAILISLAIMLFSLVGCGTQKVSLEEYFIVTVEGYDGYGKASVTVDSAMLNELVEQEKVSEYISSLSDDPYSEYMAEMMAFNNLIDYEILDNGNLSNGDVVTISIGVSDEIAYFGETLESMQEGLGISIEKTVIEVPVEGLEEAKVVDVMTIIDDYIVYTGANGGAQAKVSFPEDFTCEIDGFTFVRYYTSTYNPNVLKVIKDNEYVRQVTYVCEYEGSLSEGQTYEVVVDDEYGITVGDTGYIMNMSKSVTVPDLPEYVNTKEGLTPELKVALEDTMKEQKDNFTVLGYYWGTLKSSAVTDNPLSDTNHIFALVSFDSWFGRSMTRLCEVNEMIQLTDGTYSIKVEFKSLDDVNSPTDKHYDLEELEW